VNTHTHTHAHHKRIQKLSQAVVQDGVLNIFPQECATVIIQKTWPSEVWHSQH